MRITKWHSIMVILISLFTLYYIAPAITPDGFISPKIKKYMVESKIKLGLDLRGGVSLLLEPDIKNYEKEQLQIIRSDIVNTFNSEKIKIISNKISDDKIEIKFSNDVSTESIEAALDKSLGENKYKLEDNHPIYFIKPNNTSNKEKVISRIIDVISYRIDAVGVQEITIQQQGEENILIQIPGISDPTNIKNILSQTGSLKLYLADNKALNSGENLPLGTKLLPLMDSEKSIPVYIQPLMYGEMIADAQYGTNMGKHIVHFKLTNAGSKKFADITKKNVGNILAIAIDEKVITAPVINEPIMTGSGIITGNFDAETAKQLAILLRSGALPTPVKIIEERIVGPTMGLEAIKSGVEAIIVGLIGVVLVMILVYRVLGIFASIALLFNLTIMLSILSMIDATLTMPGLAGIALTLGMAVDANVLIYERMREELKRKQSFLKAMEMGYHNALRTILDSNITTILVGIVLYIFGSSAVKGFSVTLIIGILCSMLTAVTFTKVFIMWWYKMTPRKV